MPFFGALTEVMRSTEQSVCSSLRSTSRIWCAPARTPNVSSTALICPDCVEHVFSKVCLLLVLSSLLRSASFCCVSIVFHWILMTSVDSSGFQMLPFATSLSTTSRWLTRNCSCEVGVTSSSVA